MDFKLHARHLLGTARQYTLKQLTQLVQPEHWVYRPTPTSNHALWIMGHLAIADNRFATRFRESTHLVPAGYEELFWIGTECHSSLLAYPPIEEVRAYLDERRENLQRVLDEVTDEELAVPVPAMDPASPMATAPNLGQYLLYGAAHEMLHSGQLSVCCRGLGHPPLR
ncbi:DinB family protein [Aeoliella sp. ICT_H6.2]|uniref:DinB family protein n=1 Tax=Aeoliella straminimaris TaxID=2954799 RepID=A0A9X2JJF5_9BACT|nr:DinB family protein [Aeoliella straminimaris]MCO6048115.1 DinB family protein [Aeoliella straminimaris]